MEKKLQSVVHVLRRFVVSEWGGVESASVALARQQKALGIDAQIFCTAMLSEPGLDHYQAIQIRRFPYSFPWFFLGQDARTKMAYKGGSPLSLSLFHGLLKEEPLSLIHTHVGNRLGGIVRTVARWRRIPYVVTVHGGHATLPDYQARSMMEPFAGRLEWGKVFGYLLGSRETLRDASAVICVNPEEQRQLQELYPHTPVHYIPNGVDSEAFGKGNGVQFRCRYGIAQDTPLLLCVSRFDDQKNQKLLVEAFARCRKRQPKAILMLIGSISVPDYFKQVQQEIAQLGLKDSIRIITGLQPSDPMLYGAYAAADLFVLPSRVEQQGIVILEAWSAKVPVVASRVDGIPAFVKDEETALLFDSEDAGMLSNKILAILENPALANKLAERAAQEVQHFSWSCINRKLMEVYREVLQHKQQAGCS